MISPTVTFLIGGNGRFRATSSHPDHAAGRTAVIIALGSCSTSRRRIRRRSWRSGWRSGVSCWALTTPHWRCTRPTHEAFYLQYFGCRPYFAERVGGFTMRTTQAVPSAATMSPTRVVVYLSSITPLGGGSWRIGAHHRCASCCPGRRRRVVMSGSTPAPENAATSTCGGEHPFVIPGRSGPQGCRRSLHKRPPGSALPDGVNWATPNKRVDPLVQTLVRNRTGRLPTRPGYEQPCRHAPGSGRGQVTSRYPVTDGSRSIGQRRPPWSANRPACACDPPRGGPAGRLRRIGDLHTEGA